MSRLTSGKLIIDGPNYCRCPAHRKVLGRVVGERRRRGKGGNAKGPYVCGGVRACVRACSDQFPLYFIRCVLVGNDNGPFFLLLLLLAPPLLLLLFSSDFFLYFFSP